MFSLNHSSPSPPPLTFSEAASGIFGSISLSCWLFLLLPQLLENIRRQSASGVSQVFLILWLFGDIANLFGAVLAQLVPTAIWLAVYFTIADGILLSQVGYYNFLERRREKKRSEGTWHRGADGGGGGAGETISGSGGAGSDLQRRKSSGGSGVSGVYNTNQRRGSKSRWRRERKKSGSWTASERDSLLGNRHDSNSGGSNPSAVLTAQPHFQLIQPEPSEGHVGAGDTQRRRSSLIEPVMFPPYRPESASAGQTQQHHQHHHRRRHYQDRRHSFASSHCSSLSTTFHSSFAFPTSEFWYNTLAVLGIVLAGTVGWAIAYEAGLWKPTPGPDSNVLAKSFSAVKVGGGGNSTSNIDSPPIATPTAAGDAGPAYPFSHHQPSTETAAQILGYFSAAAYLGARIPQIIKNQKARSCEGLSLLFFILSMLGNLTYGAGIVAHSIDPSYLRTNVPWLLGSLGTMAEDAIIFAQFRVFGSGSSPESADELDHRECDYGTTRPSGEDESAPGTGTGTALTGARAGRAEPA